MSYTFDYIKNETSFIGKDITKFKKDTLKMYMNHKKVFEAKMKKNYDSFYQLTHFERQQAKIAANRSISPTKRIR